MAPTLLFTLAALPLFFAAASARTSSGTAAARARARGGVISPPERVDSQQVCYVPRFEPTYNMTRSTIVMPCNDSGFFDVSLTARFGVVDYDWSNAKNHYVNQKPMTCEEDLIAQAAMVKAANPEQKVFIYRNLVKALPWYTNVWTKLADPAFAGWFVEFDKHNSTPFHVPPCDDNYSPPLCSTHYHDQGASSMVGNAHGGRCGAASPRPWGGRARAGQTLTCHVLCCAIFAFERRPHRSSATAHRPRGLCVPPFPCFFATYHPEASARHPYPASPPPTAPNTQTKPPATRTVTALALNRATVVAFRAVSTCGITATQASAHTCSMKLFLAPRGWEMPMCLDSTLTTGEFYTRSAVRAAVRAAVCSALRAELRMHEGSHFCAHTR